MGSGQRTTIPALDLQSLAPLKLLPRNDGSDRSTLTARLVDSARGDGEGSQWKRHGESSGRTSSPRLHMLPGTFTTLSLASPINSFGGGSTPRSAVETPMGTPRSAIRKNPGQMQSPLKMVGKASPCSVKLTSSARLEGSKLIGPLTEADICELVGPSEAEKLEIRLAPHRVGTNSVQKLGTKAGKASALSALKQEMYPRELSFGNLLDNDGDSTRVAIEDDHPKPIGLVAGSHSASPRELTQSSAQMRTSLASLPDGANNRLTPEQSPRKRSRKAATPTRASINA